MFYTSFLVLCPCFISQLNPQINTNTSSLMWIDTLYSVWIFLIWVVCVFWYVFFASLISRSNKRTLLEVKNSNSEFDRDTPPLPDVSYSAFERDISKFSRQEEVMILHSANSSIIILHHPFSETHCIEKWLSHLNLYRGNIIYKGSECSKL